MDADFLALLKQENRKEEEYTPVAESGNPFSLPQQAELFGGRELELRRRQVEHAAMRQLSIVERADLQHPSIPPCALRHNRTAKTSLGHIPIVEPRSSDRAVRAQRMTDFICEKRAMYLLQLIIDRQRKQIETIENRIAAAEKAKKDEEEQTEVLTKQYKLQQVQMEARLGNAMRRAEKATVLRVDLQAKLKRAASSVSNTKSNIVKGQDALEDYRKYAAFMRIMTPEEFAEPSEYFDVPQKMIDCLEEIEDGNLLLIRGYQFYGEKVNDSGQGIEEATAASSEKISVVEELLRGLPQIVEQNARLSDGVFEKGRCQDDEYERLYRLISAAYVSCFHSTVELSPLAMLLQIENTLEDFYKRADRVSREFMAAKIAEHNKRRREESRAKKQIRQEQEQKMKMDQALARATEPFHKRDGRALMPRSLPYRRKEEVDVAQLAALREQERLQELLYGELA
jgi:hypothetical protein